MGKKSRRNRAKAKPQATSAPKQDDRVHERISELVSNLPSNTSSEQDGIRAVHVLADIMKVIVSDKSGSSRALIQLGGISTVLNLMQETAYSGVLFFGCFFLSSVASMDYKEDLEIKQVIAQAGGIPLILSALRGQREYFPDLPNEGAGLSLRNALGLLCSMAYDQTTAKSIQEYGGVTESVLLLRNHVTDGEMQTSIIEAAMALIRALGLLVSETVVVSEVISCGGVPTVLACVETYPNERGINLLGCALVAMLSALNPSAVLAADGDDVMKKAIQRHDDCLAKEWAGRAICSMEKVVPQCRACGKKSEDMKVCNRCYIAWYCSDDCLATDWHQNHEAVCNAARWRPCKKE